MRGNQEAAPRITRTGHRQLGRGTPRGALEPANYTKHCNPIPTLLHGVREEAVLPHDLRFGAPRVTGYEEEEAEEALQDDKDTADEARDAALAKSEGYKDKLRTYQSSRLRTRTFNKGDLVLRLIQEKVHKLAPPQWEGPFIVS